MGAKKIYDLAVKVGSYESNGETKGKYQTIGSVLQKDDGGKFILIEPWFNPAGVPHESDRSVMVSMFEPKPRDGGGEPARQAQRQPESRTSVSPPPGECDDQIMF